MQGRVLEEILRRYSPKRVAYVGDGGGDFCPACELRTSVFSPGIPGGFFPIARAVYSNFFPF